MVGLCSGKGMGRNMEAWNRISEPDQSKKVFTLGCEVETQHAGAKAGKEGSHVRGGGNRGRLATYQETYHINKLLKSNGIQESHCQRG